MIELKNITKTFRGKGSFESQFHDIHAVRNVSLSVGEGDIFGVIGFSGAGKSTLVRCINLLERPDAGEVIINGGDLMKLSKGELHHARKKIGMVFQHFNLFRSRTVAGNIAFPLKYGWQNEERNNGQTVDMRVTELLELVGLSDKVNAYPSQLSGGQKQRVGIARALASNPSILLCDEATSALDPQTTQSILALLRELNKKLGITIVIITHEMQVIKSICSHAAIMDSGEIVERGSVFDIFSNPKEQITRDFIATTSHLNKINDFLAEDTPITRLGPGQVLARFSYSGPNTVEALISTASIQFNVKLNIIFGDLDIIQEKPIGGLVIILDGEKEAAAKAMEWFRSRGVKVEVLKHG
ncbi:MAG: methionine ABC transporter ATP-binding protein [Treponema sp.]|jgi:D-methionine transport system ATP-binding protein|nr:methionine ABC transporter ATP-binding protein [Treponema sp.]